ncbi:hypothetical protein OJAV_G00192550 [Oryzias javanicus]|uniref:Uncharacterized protein n=1 Tax=Oryzias javanicus TaxID=123683 RepID=A0A437CAM6_ORYJA|nr:hypothetical protein OJAV_G00192550 [Oryzias javanicus]
MLPEVQGLHDEPRVRQGAPDLQCCSLVWNVPQHVDITEQPFLPSRVKNRAAWSRESFFILLVYEEKTLCSKVSYCLFINILLL